MAFQQNPDGTVEVVDDITGLPLAGGVPPEMLGSLYNPGAVSAAPPPAPDLRLASFGGGGGSGGTTGNAPMQSMGAEGQPNAAPPQMSIAPPVSTPGLPQSRLGAPGSGSAPQATPASGAPATEPLSGLPTEKSPLVANYLRRAMAGSPGRRVEARDQLVGFNVEKAPELSEETKLERETAAIQQQRAAAEGGMLRQASAEDAALSFERQRESAQQQIAQIRDEERQRDQIVGAKMREIDMRSGELREARKGATNPEGYWEDKGQFGTVMAKIGMALYAAGASVTGADPMGLAKQINTEIDQYNQAKRLEVELIGREIEDARTQLGDVRRQFISPEAADAATRALMLESAAAETAAQGQYHKSAEAQAVAQELMAALRAQAADARAKAELAEHDAVTQAWKHMPAGVVGGSAGGMPGLMAAARKLGITDLSEALRAADAGIIPIPKSDLELAKMELQQRGSRGAMQRRSDVEKGLVLLPEGGVAYYPNETQKVALEKSIHAIGPWQSALKEMQSIHKKASAGGELVGDDRARLDVLQSEAASYVKEVAANEALTSGEDQEMWKKLRGASANEISILIDDEKSLEQVLKATERYNRKARGMLRQVPEDYSGPMPKPLVAPIQSRDQ